MGTRTDVIAAFEASFTGAPAVVVRSPGRVNLIGDHTDYNDGFVLPIAIEQATWLAARRRTDRIVEVVSLEKGAGSLSLDQLSPTGSWLDYVAGVLAEVDAPGIDLVVGTEIPIGAGLSSSAALELGVLRVAAELGNGEWDAVAMAMAGQRSENDFVGVPSGIMDQLVVALGEEGAALLLDCRSLAAEVVLLPEGVSVVVLDTGTRRRLVASEYAVRRADCERAAMALGVTALRDATADMIGSLDPGLARRARHVIGENERTVAAADALRTGDVTRAGSLMTESHASLRDDFEVSSAALDAMADIAAGHPAAFGARMTGGGFAGCGVALVEVAGLTEFVDDVSAAYDAATGNSSALYPTRGARGVAVE